jgi:hypothetical protein
MLLVKLASARLKLCRFEVERLERRGVAPRMVDRGCDKQGGNLSAAVAH